MARIFLDSPSDELTTYIFDACGIVALSTEEVPPEQRLNVMLTQKEAAALIPILQRFVESGSIEEKEEK